jgi:hypothetical protein
MRGTPVAAAVIGAALVVAGGAPALAQVARGDRDSSGIEAGAQGPGSGPNIEPVSTRPHRGGGGSAPTCTAVDGNVGPVNYRPVPTHLLQPDERDRVAREGGAYYLTFCGGELAPWLPGNRLDYAYRPAGTPGASQVDPGELAVQALERTPLPEPDITMAPAPDIPQLVNLTTFLWLPSEQWRPTTASASAGGVTSTVTATPTRVIWDMGQGDTVVCDGPGVPYRPDLPDERQPSDCHYTYRFSSAGAPGNAFTVTATVEWETTWSVTGAPGGGSLGTVRRSASTRVQVAELQVVNVYPTAP